MNGQENKQKKYYILTTLISLEGDGTFGVLSGSQTTQTLYLDRLSRPIVSRHAMLHFHVMFFD